MVLADYRCVAAALNLLSAEGRRRFREGVLRDQARAATGRSGPPRGAINEAPPASPAVRQQRGATGSSGPPHGAVGGDLLPI